MSASIVDSACRAAALGSGPVVVGVSGGMDSMVLLRALSRVVPVVVAHVNYGLRPGADEDTRLVETWCAEHAIPCHVYRVADEEGGSPSGSVQAWARDIRYAYFKRIAQQEGAGFVCVAHHADDQAETVALAGRRAAGPGGLSGMSPRRAFHGPSGEGSAVVLVRPLLDVPRSAIRDAAIAWEVPWRDDPSNRNPDFARVRERMAMTPSDRRFWLAVAGAARKTEAAWAASLPDGAAQALSSPGAPVHVSDAAWQAMRPAVRPWFLLRLVERMDGRAPRRRSTVERLTALWDASPGRHVTTGSVSWIRDRDGLTVQPVEASDPLDAITVRVPVAGSVPIRFGSSGGTLVVHAEGPVPDTAHTPETEAWLDADTLAPPLEFRPWRDGDRFHPLGAPGSRKMKAFLTDAGVRSSRKRAVHVLTAAGSIVWVAGLRPAHDARIQATTRAAVRVVWEAAEPEG